MDNASAACYHDAMTMILWGVDASGRHGYLRVHSVCPAPEACRDPHGVIRLSTMKERIDA